MKEKIQEKMKENMKEEYFSYFGIKLENMRIWQENEQRTKDE